MKGIILHLDNIHVPGRLLLEPGHIYWLEGGHGKTCIARYENENNFKTLAVKDGKRWPWRWWRKSRRPSSSRWGEALQPPRHRTDALHYTQFTAIPVEEMAEHLPTCLGWSIIYDEFYGLLKDC